MAMGWILSYSLPRGTPASERRRFERSLFGYTDRSYYGAYQYEREGFLSNKPHIALRSGILLLPLDHRASAEKFIRAQNGSVWRRKLELSLNETKRLYPPLL
jgi:hypothetical protein